MRYSDTLELFEQSFEYPVSHDAVAEEFGGVELAVPTGETVTLRDVLERTDEASYRSADALYTSLLRNLEDGFIGRKYYDDRAGARSGADRVSGEDVSF
jgi:hypothetical protein